MKKIITFILLLFAVETFFHIIIVVAYINLKSEGYSNNSFFEGWNYIKLKLVFYLLPYLIAHTYILKSKKRITPINYGFIQLVLFGITTLLFSPITWFFFYYFKSILAVAAFLSTSFLTPILLHKIIGHKNSINLF